MFRSLQGYWFWVGALLIISVISCSLYFHVLWAPYALLGLFLTVLFFLFPEKLFWLTIISIPLSFEYSIGSHFGTDFPDELFMLCSTGAFLLLLPFLSKKPLKDSISLPIFLLVVIQYGWSVVSAFHSSEAMLSTKFILSKLWYIIPFVFLPQLVLNNKTTFRKLAYCIVIPVLAVSLYTLVRHSMFGFSFVSINEAASPIFRNHVTYAASLSIALAVVLGCLIMNPDLRKKWSWLLVITILLIAIYFSYTRGSWLSVICSAVMILIMKWNRTKWLIVTFCMILFGFLYFITQNNRYLALQPDFEKTIIHNKLSEHLDAMYSMKELSTSERIYRWVAGFRMSSVHPITGFGPASFYSQYKKYTDSRFRTYVSDNPEKSTVHNYFLLTTVEQGFPGIIILLSLLIVFFLRCQKLFLRIQDPFYRSVILILVLAMTHIVTVNFFSDMIETDKIGTFYFLAIGVLIAVERKIKSGEIVLKNV